MMRNKTQNILATFEDLARDYRQLKDDYDTVANRLKRISNRLSAARALAEGEVEDNPTDKKLAAEYSRIQAIIEGKPQDQSAEQPKLSIVETQTNSTENGAATVKKGENTLNLINGMKEAGNHGYTVEDISIILNKRETPLPRFLITNILGKQVKREVIKQDGEKYYLTSLGMQYVPNKKARHIAAG